MAVSREAEEFAASLRALKGRTGRSYGALARRLNISASTLHRYCSGEAVPVEYAAIERLARLCEATREEQVELHRLWILASAARRRMQSARGVKPPAAPSIGTAPEHAVGGGPGAARPVPRVPGSAGTGEPGIGPAPTAYPVDPAVPLTHGPQGRRPHATAAPHMAPHMAAVDRDGPAESPAAPPGVGPSAQDAADRAQSGSRDGDPDRDRDWTSDSDWSSDSDWGSDGYWGSDRNRQRHEQQSTGTEAPPGREAVEKVGDGAAPSAAAVPSTAAVGQTMPGGDETAAPASAAPAPAAPAAPDRPAGPPLTAPAGPSPTLATPAAPVAPKAPAVSAAARGQAESPAAAQASAVPDGLPAPENEGGGEAPPASREDSDSSPRNQADGQLAAAASVPAPRPAAWYRRYRWPAVAAAAATVVLTLIALDFIPFPPGGEKAPAGSGAGANGSEGELGPAASVSPSLSSPGGLGSANAPASESSGTSSSSDTAARPGGTAGHAPLGDRPGGPAAVPLSWTAKSHIWKDGCDHAYLLDRPKEKMPPPPSEQDAEVWASSLGAVHGGETVVRIAVQGDSDATVVLDALHVRVVGRAAPSESNVYLMNQGCGGALTPRMFGVDLDADRPMAVARPGHDGEKEIPAVRFPYRVSADDPEILLVQARTQDCDCRWYLELEWSSQGRSGTVRIDDHGKPFRTGSTEGLPRYSYDPAERVWVRD